MMETMIPPQVGMRLRTLKINKRGQRIPNKKEAKEAQIKKRKAKKGRPKKMREKERRDNVTILLPHLCFKIAP